MRSMPRIMYFLIMLVFVIPSLSKTYGQTEVAGEVLTALRQVPQAMPQQKLFIHTDKDEYLAGESIWFRAYLVNAYTHEPDHISTNLQVHLLSVQGDLIDFGLVRMQNGYGFGDFQLPDSLPDGNYHILGYTDLMEAWGEDEAFRKKIFVHNKGQANYINRAGMRQNRRFNNDLDKLQSVRQFAIFPEGGHLVKDIDSRVAFKAADGLGNGLDISGSLHAADGTKLLTFESFHDGMGSFTFTPERGQSYTARVKFPDGRSVEKVLPEALDEGYALKVDREGENLRVGVETNFDSRQYNIPLDIFILVQTRGHAYFYELGQLRQGRFSTTLPLDMLPTGVAQITVFDANSTPLAERLVFVNHDDIHQVSVQTAPMFIGGREGVEANAFFGEVNIGDDRAGFSTALLGGFGKPPSYGENIATWFYLTSEIGHLIKEPWYYLSGTTEAHLKASDLLMLTHGWRRFDWDNILAGDFGNVDAEPENRLTIKGNVALLRAQDSPGEQTVELRLYDGTAAEVYRTTSRHTGEFKFDGLEFDELTRVSLIVPESRRERQLIVELDRREYDRQPYNKGFYTQSHDITRRGTSWRRISQPITTLPSHTEAKRSEPPSMLGVIPDQVLYIDDIRGEPDNMESLLIGRVQIFRGPVSINLSTTPVYLLDGTTVSQQAFMSLNPLELEKIEIFTGPSTARFGASGAAGALHAVSKSGDTGYSSEFTVTGYHIPRRFYQHEIQYHEYRELNVEKTIMWDNRVRPDARGRSRYVFLGLDDFDYVRLIFQGVDSEGRIVFTEQMIK